MFYLNDLFLCTFHHTCHLTPPFPVYLPPANKVCEGYVFTGVCLSTGRGSLPRGFLSSGVVSVQGGLCSGGSLFREGGLCPGGGLCPEVRIILECILVNKFFLDFVSAINESSSRL